MKLMKHCSCWWASILAKVTFCTNWAYQIFTRIAMAMAGPVGPGAMSLYISIRLFVRNEWNLNNACLMMNPALLRQSSYKGVFTVQQPKQSPTVIEHVRFTWSRRPELCNAKQDSLIHTISDHFFGNYHIMLWNHLRYKLQYAYCWMHSIHVMYYMYM